MDDDHLDRCFHDLGAAGTAQADPEGEVRGGRSPESRLDLAKKMLAEKIQEEHA